VDWYLLVAKLLLCQCAENPFEERKTLADGGGGGVHTGSNDCGYNPHLIRPSPRPDPFFSKGERICSVTGPNIPQHSHSSLISLMGWLVWCESLEKKPPPHQLPCNLIMIYLYTHTYLYI
jgi:hypothetical protein